MTTGVGRGPLTPRRLRAAACAALLATTSGCGSWWQRNFAARELVTEGLSDDPARLAFTFPYAWYEQQPAQTSLYLSDLSPEQLAAGGDLTGQVAHVQVLWLPRPGWTPARKGCTNVVIRLLVLSRGEIGLYGGGGFAWPWDEPGDPSFGMEVLASSLSLLEKTEGFVDLLSPAQMTGVLDAPRDDGAAQRMRLITSQLVTNAFQSVRWVRIWNGEDSGVDLADSGDFGLDHVQQRLGDRRSVRIVTTEEPVRCTAVEVDQDEPRVLQLESTRPPAVREVAHEW